MVDEGVANQNPEVSVSPQSGQSMESLDFENGDFEKAINPTKICCKLELSTIVYLK
jgi:hypothetical protein